MRLYLVNPDNPVVSLNNIRWNRLNRYRVWKPLRLLVVAGLTPPDWEVTLIDENLGHPDYERLPKPDLVGITALTSQAPRAYEVAPMYRATGVPVVSEAFTPRFVAKRGWTTRMRWSRERRNRCGGRCWPSDPREFRQIASAVTRGNPQTCSILSMHGASPGCSHFGGGAYPRRTSVVLGRSMSDTAPATFDAHCKTRNIFRGLLG
jgi:hypothetical protein